MEIYTAEPLVHKSGSLELGVVTATLKRYKHPGTDEIPA
jgi:hypothetical protein